MARKQVDLGRVGFGLEADTTQLQSSLRTLRQFGQQVNSLSQATDAAGQKMFAKFAGIERQLTSLFSRTQAVTSKMREAGIAAPEIDKVSNAYRRLTKEVTTNASALNRANIGRATQGMSAIISRGHLQVATKQANQLSLAFRDLERAAILAVGPLSGIGARLAVLAALMESTGAKITLFIAGITGVATGFGLLAAAGVRATMDMQRFEAQLETASGSAALAGEEYQFVSSMAEKWGQNVRGLVEPYAKFATAARLSNVTIGQTREIYEAATVAGTAMRLSTERQGLVFLALEQMLSKGVVTMEELRRQMGDLIPGSFELAAKAMGVTRQELAKMIKSGEVLSSDMLPKLAKLWIEVFGPGAVRASHTLQAELERTRTATFELQKAFDKAVGTSDAFRTAVVGFGDVLRSLTENMDKVMGVIGAMAGAGGMIALIALAARAGTAIMGLVKAFIALRAATLGAGAALAAFATGGGLAALGRLALIIGGAVVGYELMSQKIDEVVIGTEDLTDKTKAWLDVHEKIGGAEESVTNRVKDEVQKRLDLIRQEIEALDIKLRAYSTAERAAAEMASKTPKMPLMELAAGARGIAGTGPQSQTRVDQVNEDLAKGLERRKVLIKSLEDLQEQLNRLNALPTTKTPPEGKASEVGTGWTNWFRRIKELTRDAQSLQDQINSFDMGEEAVRKAEAVNKALDLMGRMPSKKAGDLKMVADYLRQAGIEGKNLTEQLTNMFLLIESRKDALKDMEKSLREAQQNGEKLSNMFRDLEARRKGALAADPEEYKSQEQLEKNLAKIVEMLKSMGVEQQHINYLVAEYRAQWDQVSGLEKEQKRLVELRKEMDRLFEHTGNKGQRALVQMQNQLKDVDEALQKGVIGYEDYYKLQQAIQDDALQNMLSKTEVFGRAVTDLMRSLENDLSKTFADILLGNTKSWGDMWDIMKQQAAEFVAKMLVIAPLMKGLFGGLYTGKSQDLGTGLLEGIVGKISGGLGNFLTGLVGSTASPEAVALAAGIAPMAGGGDLGPGQMALVGEAGPEIIKSRGSNQIVPNDQLGGVTNIFQVDMRGAPVETVNELRKLVMSVNGSIEKRAIAAVRDAKSRGVR